MGGFCKCRYTNLFIIIIIILLLLLLLLFLLLLLLCNMPILYSYRKIALEKASI